MDLAVVRLHAPGVFTGFPNSYRQAEAEDRHLAELLPFYVFVRALTATEWSSGVVRDAATDTALLRRTAAQMGRLPAAETGVACRPRSASRGQQSSRNQIRPLRSAYATAWQRLRRWNRLVTSWRMVLIVRWE